MKPSQIRLVCLDIDGTLTDGVQGPPIAGTAEAVAAIRARLPVRLVTNTTSVPHAVLAETLIRQGFLDVPASLVTPATVARRVLPGRGHARGLLHVEPAARPDFEWFQNDAAGPAVVLATEGHDLRIADLQSAFRMLLEGAAFYTLQRNRYFKKGGEMVTDLGPVAAFLSYASGREVETLGKPSPILFDSIAEESGVRRAEIAMVGDDAEFDVSASVALGMAGILVRTGKFRREDADRFDPRPTVVLDSVGDLPGWLGIR
jgi:phospholysine phosphohistidine inorganic pyrophosphate phosphatase